MAAQRGKDLLLKIDDGTGNFLTVAGIRTRRIVFNATALDTTSANSSGYWRELFSGATEKHASVSGSGLFKDATSDLRMRQVFFDGVICPWQLIFPALGIIQGPFQVTVLDYRGEQNLEMTFDITLESAGILTFTASA